MSKLQIHELAKIKRDKLIEKAKKSRLFRVIYYIKLNWWRFTPDSWINWLYYWRAELRYKYAIWKLWSVLPWQNNSRCSVCAGYKSQAGEFCYHCDGKGYTPRWNETFLSKVFKKLGLRFENKPKN